MKNSACQELKEQTGDLHQQANSTAFMKRLVSARIGLQEYVTWLRALSVIYSVLETQLSRSTDKVICSVWKEEMRKLALLEQDIDALHEKSWFDLKAPIAAALRGAELIRVQSLANPWRIIGYLYVLEGSTNGASLIYPRVQHALNLDDQTGTNYLRNYQEAQNQVWREFKNRIDQTVLSTTAVDAAVAGAREIFTVLCGIMQSFDEVSVTCKIHVTAINPEAGDHKVPQLEEDIQAVLLASESAYNRIPYIQARYGLRGKKFTQSDGAWLATLPDLPEPSVMKQINWLAKLLSSIGLPRIALEIHLQETEKQLARLHPANSQKYAVLGLAAEHLAIQRNQAIDSGVQAAVTTRFYSKLGFPDKAEYLAEILVSAKADENIDDSSVVSGILTWLDGSICWSEQVKQAAHELVSELQ
jgi:heme oxygenase